VLGAKVCRGTDSAALADGFIFFGAWAMLLNCAHKASVMGGYTNKVMLFNAAMALVAARRSGGLFSKLSRFDVDSVSNMLPSKANFEAVAAKKNLVGLQLFGWGAAAYLCKCCVLGANGLGMACSPVTKYVASGLAVANLLLAGRVLKGSDEDAAAVGLVSFAGWAAVAYFAKSSGAWTGAYLLAGVAWNTAVAAYCAFA